MVACTNHNASEDHVAGRHVKTKVQDALSSCDNDVLANTIKQCSKSTKRCQSMWCARCRTAVSNSLYNKIKKRSLDAESVYKTLHGTIDPASKSFNDYMNSEHRHVSGYVGLFSLDNESVIDGLKFDRKRWKKIKERNHTTKFWITGNYELELVNFHLLINSANTGSVKKQKQMEQLLPFSIKNGWIKQSEEIGVLLHWHATTNAKSDEITRAVGDTYFIDGVRSFKTSESGLYVQSLHKNKSFDENIKKISSYAFKSATKYKHTFVGSDVGNKSMSESDLNKLITLYHCIQGRNWRSIMFNHTVG